jgi:hypothetical protein
VSQQCECVCMCVSVFVCVCVCFVAYSLSVLQCSMSSSHVLCASEEQQRQAVPCEDHERCNSLSLLCWPPAWLASPSLLSIRVSVFLSSSLCFLLFSLVFSLSPSLLLCFLLLSPCLPCSVEFCCLFYPFSVSVSCPVLFSLVLFYCISPMQEHGRATSRKHDFQRGKPSFSPDLPPCLSLSLSLSPFSLSHFSFSFVQSVLF